MKLEILLNEDYPHPIGKVWAALIEPIALAQWLMANDFEPRVGKRFTFRGTAVPGWRGWNECVVLEIEPPYRMVWSWSSSEEGDPTRVEFRLEQIESGTRLTLMHTGEIDSTAGGRLSSGWPVKLGGLGALLARPA